MGIADVIDPSVNADAAARPPLPRPALRSARRPSRGALAPAPGRLHPSRLGTPRSLAPDPVTSVTASPRHSAVSVSACSAPPARTLRTCQSAREGRHRTDVDVDSPPSAPPPSPHRYHSAGSPAAVATICRIDPDMRETMTTPTQQAPTYGRRDGDQIEDPNVEPPAAATAAARVPARCAIPTRSRAASAGSASAWVWPNAPRREASPA